MSSFLRIAGAAALVLSLGLVARALPVTIFANLQIGALAHSDAVSVALNKLIVEADLALKVKALLECATVADLKVALSACLDPIKVCADAFLKAGAGVVVNAQAKADIVGCVAAIITLFVQVCIQLTLKFGLSVVAALFVELDLCLRLLLVNLDICIDGIVILIVKACANVTVGLLAQVNLAACAKLFIGN